jgi:hypothetical protein
MEPFHEIKPILIALAKKGSAERAIAVAIVRDLTLLAWLY